MLGTQELVAYLEKYELTLDSHFDGVMGRYTKKPWKKFVADENRHLASDEALDFLDRLLRYDPAERVSAREAMEHPYFYPVRAREHERAASAGAK